MSAVTRRAHSRGHCHCDSGTLATTGRVPIHLHFLSNYVTCARASGAVAFLLMTDVTVSRGVCLFVPFLLCTLHVLCMGEGRGMAWERVHFVLGHDRLGLKFGTLHTPALMGCSLYLSSVPGTTRNPLKASRVRGRMTPPQGQACMALVGAEVPDKCYPTSRGSPFAEPG